VYAIVRSENYIVLSASVENSNKYRRKYKIA